MADAGDWAVLVEAQEKEIRAKRNLADQVSSLSLSSAATPPAATPPTARLPAATPPAARPPVATTPASTTPASTPPAPTAPAATGGADPDDEKELTSAEASLLRKCVRTNLIESKHDIEILRQDPNSPLYSVKTFQALNLKKQLLDGVYAMGFKTPSKIQETALPALLAERPANMIAQSQSGTGKTATFVLTMLSRVDVSKQYPQCLCLAPTYELALQIGEVTQEMGKFIQGLKIKFAVRQEPYSRGVPLTEHIIIGTPGTTVDYCTRYKIFDPKKIDVFVLDEADIMIDTQGHQDASVRLRKLLRNDCQMLLFSATYVDDVMKFANAIIPNPFIIKLRREEESLDNIRQFFMECKDDNHKYSVICNIYGAITIGQCMIFCQTRKTASWLSQQMVKEGHTVAILTGDLTVEQRAAVIKRFKEGKEKVLITTNVTARGIDVEQVTLVINFDLPVDVTRKIDCETYLHRIGRTGRFGRMGSAINLVDGPRSREMLREIEEHFNRKIEQVDGDNLDAIAECLDDD